jgi:hypothetical protein
MWPDLQELQKMIEDLKIQSRNLGALLMQAGEQLSSSGICPAPDLMAKWQHFQRLHQQLRTQLDVQGLVDNRGQLLTDSIQQLEQAWERKYIQRQTQDIINAILSLNHNQVETFSPLDNVKKRAEEIKLQLVHDKLTRDEADSRSREFKDLLKLATESDKLLDDEWTQLMDTMVHTFGRPIAIAAARGHLGVSVI